MVEDPCSRPSSGSFCPSDFGSVCDCAGVAAPCGMLDCDDVLDPVLWSGSAAVDSVYKVFCQLISSLTEPWELWLPRGCRGSGAYLRIVRGINRIQDIIFLRTAVITVRYFNATVFHTTRRQPIVFPDK